jgi:hypothetical protein
MLSRERWIVPLERYGVPCGESIILAGLRVALGSTRVAAGGPAAAGSVTTDARLLNDRPASAHGCRCRKERCNHE